MTDEQPHPTVDGPTAMAPATGRLDDPPPSEPPENDATTQVAPGAPAAEDENTAAGGWPLDEFEPAPELVRRVAVPGAVRGPAYYVSLGAAAVLVVGLVALAAVVAVMRPQREVAGSASAFQDGIPEITASATVAPPSTTPVGPGPLAELAAHPLSSSAARMADATCELPRFDPADDRQAAFYAAAKVCADDAWRGVLREAGLDGPVTVVTVTGAERAGSCGELAPTSAATQCDGTVYLTPAYLRDTERNGRYPGRYLGVFLREYARALQSVTGLDQLVAAVPGGAAEDLDTRRAQQATCLAGVVSGAMSGRGAVDGNITNEIRDRLTTVDAPPDARAWLDKGFGQRTLDACNTWG